MYDKYVRVIVYGAMRDQNRVGTKKSSQPVKICAVFPGEIHYTSIYILRKTKKNSTGLGFFYKVRVFSISGSKGTGYSHRDLEGSS